MFANTTIEGLSKKAPRGTQMTLDDAELETMRNKLFEKNNRCNSIVIAWNKHEINWTKTVEAFKFRNKEEAQKWLENKIEGVNILTK